MMIKRSDQPPARDRAIFLLFLLLFFAAVLWMAIRLPAQAAPNELLHYEYVHLLRQTRRLPQDGLDNTETRLTELHQPPLYYAFAAAVSTFEAQPTAPVNDRAPLVAG